MLLPLFSLKERGCVSPPLGALPLQLLQAEPLALGLLNASEYEKRLVALQAQLRENAAGHQGELLSAQIHLAELESQVRDPACRAEAGLVSLYSHWSAHWSQTRSDRTGLREQ